MESNVAEAICLSCGGNRFELVGRDEDPDLYRGLGAVTMDGSGRLRTYDGTYICYECEEILTLPQVSFVPLKLSPELLEDLRTELPPLRVVDPSRAAPD